MKPPTNFQLSDGHISIQSTKDEIPLSLQSTRQSNHFTEYARAFNPPQVNVAKQMESKLKPPSVNRILTPLDYRPVIFDTAIKQSTEQTNTVKRI